MDDTRRKTSNDATEGEPAPALPHPASVASKAPKAPEAPEAPEAIETPIEPGDANAQPI